MARYQKKPIIVDAELYRPGLEDGWAVVVSDMTTIMKTFEHESDAWAWLNNNLHMAEAVLPAIRTLEGWCAVGEGTWIITGVEG